MDRLTPAELGDDFNGDNAHLVECITALLELDAKGALVPHGIGKHARRLLGAAGTRLLASSRPSADRGEPIPMVLHCPKCGLQHIDEPDPGPVDLGDANEWDAKYPAWETTLWTNPPHRSHPCHGCGHIWRPADVPTTGVAAVQTKGKADSPIPSPPSAGDGWQTVPVTPTPGMITAADELDAELRSQGFNGAEVGAIYAAMLSAAPPPPAQEPAS